MGQADMRALAQASASVRTRRAELKRALRAGEVAVHDLLAGNAPLWEPAARGMKVGGLLEAIPGVGPKARDEALEAIGVERDARLGGLGYATRKQLADLMNAALYPIETPVVPERLDA